MPTGALAQRGGHGVGGHGGGFRAGGGSFRAGGGGFHPGGGGVHPGSGFHGFRGFHGGYGGWGGIYPGGDTKFYSSCGYVHVKYYRHRRPYWHWIYVCE